MSKEACIQRQKIVEQKFVTLKTKLKEDVFHYRQVNVPESFMPCVNCKQGQEVNKNPNKYSDDDVKEVTNKQIQTIACRGYIHKERTPVDFRALEMTGNIEKAELNYIEGRHNVNMDFIGRISTYSIKRRKINGKQSRIIIGTGRKTITLTDRTIRIVRYLCKQGYFARSESNFFQSIGLCAGIK
jgi:hypothetical protein